MASDESDVVVPVIAEQLHVDAEPVETGGVRVVKRVIRKVINRRDLASFLINSYDDGS